MMQNAGKTLVMLLLAAQAAQADDGVPLSIPLGDGEIVLEGQATPVIGLAWSEDALVTALDGGALLQWDLESGRPRSLEPVLDGGLLELEAGAAGALVAAGSGGAWIQDSGRGYPLSGHGAAVSAAVFSPDGKQVLTADLAGRVIAWDALSGGQRWTSEAHEGAISAVAWSSDGRRVATAGADGAVHILDASTGHPRGGQADVHPGGALTVAWSPRGGRLLSGGADGVLMLWSDGVPSPLSTSGSGPVAAVVWSPDGTQIAAGQGRTVHRLHEADGWRLDAPLAVGADVTALAWSEDAVLAAGDADGGVHSWRHGAGHIHNRRGLSTAVTTLAWAEGERGHLLGQGADGKLWTWRGRKRTSIRQARGTVAAWDSSGRRVVLGHKGGRVKVRSGDATVILNGHTGAATATASAPNSSLLATAGEDGMIWLREAGSRTLLARLKGHTGAVRGMDLHGDWLASGGDDGIVRIWEGASLSRTLLASAPVDAVAWSPDRAHLAAGIQGGVRIWDAATGAVLRDLEGPSGEVEWSADGRFIAAISEGTVRIWDTASWTARPDLIGPQGAASLAWSPTGSILAAGGQSVRLWRIDAEADPLCELIAAPDGTWAVIDDEGRFDDGSEAGGIRWTLDGERIGLDQLRSDYFEPRLLPLHLSGEPLLSVRPLSTLALYPAVAITEPADARHPIYGITITDQGGGIGNVEVRLNGSDVSSALQLERESSGERLYHLDLHATPYGHNDGSDELTVWAFDARNGLSSPRGGATRGSRSAAPPDKDIAFWGIFVGVQDYRGSALDLSFPANDARALYEATAVAVSGEDLYRRGVSLQLLTTSEDAPDQQPTRENLEAAFSQLKDAQPQDVVMLYMAGHGMTFAGEYYYPTAEFGDHESLDDKVTRSERALSGDEIRSWLLESGAGKRVMILDTCESGGVDAAGESAALASRSADQTRAQALEDLHDRTGVFMLAGASAGRVSYEASRFGHGVLSYTLLQGLRGPALIDNDLVDIGQLFLYAQRQVPELARGIGGVQEPQVKLPRDGSVVIGRLSRDQIDSIDLRQELPVLLPPTMSRPIDDSDPLELAEALRMRFEALTWDADADAAAVYVNHGDLPDSYRLQGRYELEADEVTVVARLLYRESMLHEGAAAAGFKLTVEAPADPEAIARTLDSAVQHWFHRGGEAAESQDVERTADGVLILGPEEAARQYEGLVGDDDLVGRRPEECGADEPLTHNGDLSQALGWARLSFSEGRDAFAASMERLDVTLRCLIDPIEGRNAELLHRVYGLRLWAEGGGDPVPYFAASAPRSSEFKTSELTVRGAETAPLDEFEVLADNQIAIELWQDSGGELELKPSAKGRLRLNGEYARSTSEEMPYVFQRIDRNDRVLHTRYINPGDAVPSYPRLRRRLLLAGISSSIAAGALYARGYYSHCQLGWSWDNRTSYCPETWTLSDLNSDTHSANLKQNKLYSGAAIGFTTLSVSTFVALGVTFAM